MNPIPFKTRGILAGLLLGALATSGVAQAQDDYPNRPIRLLVGFSPGGGADSVARVMTEHLSKTLGQPVLVENRPGAGATLAPDGVAKAEPDGYTLLLAADSTFGADKLMWQPMVTYDETDFTPIGKWAETFFILAANPDFGVSNLDELLARIEASDENVFVGSTQGLYPAMILENFNRLANVELEQIPYKGGAPSVTAAIAGDVPLVFSVPSSIVPMNKSGQLVAIGTTSAERSPLAPDIPTLAEQGLEGLDVSYWFSLAGPAGLPDEIAEKLFDASAKALNDPKVRSRLESLGYEPAPSNSMAEFREEALTTGAQLRDTVEKLGIRGGA